MMLKKTLLCTWLSAASLFMSYASPYFFEDSFVAPDNKEN